MAEIETARLRKMPRSGFLNQGRSVRLLLWLVASALLSVFFMRDFWASLPRMLSPEWVLGQNHASPWGVLALCLLFLWVRRKEVWGKMAQSQSLVFVPIGLSLAAGAIFTPVSRDYLVFQALLVLLGVFIVFFGAAAGIPSILLGVYVFAISFPLFVQHFIGDIYTAAASVPMIKLLTVTGYPLVVDGRWLHFTSFTGEAISVVVTTACAGPATMGVFLSIFTLMTLDMPLPRRKAVRLFLFGVAGTWFQSFIRLVILMLAGFYLGEKALWTAHSWTIYILFPLWYLLFAYIYFRQFGVRNTKEAPAETSVNGDLEC